MAMLSRRFLGGVPSQPCSHTCEAQPVRSWCVKENVCSSDVCYSGFLRRRGSSFSCREHSCEPISRAYLKPLTRARCWYTDNTRRICTLAACFIRLRLVFMTLSAYAIRRLLLAGASGIVLARLLRKSAHVGRKVRIHHALAQVATSITLRRSRTVVYETDGIFTIDADAINVAALTRGTCCSLWARKLGGSVYRRPLLPARGGGTPPRHTLRLAWPAVHARFSTSSSVRAERRPFRRHATTPCVLGSSLVPHSGPMALQSLQRPGRGRCTVCMFVIHLTPLPILIGMFSTSGKTSIVNEG